MAIGGISLQGSAGSQGSSNTNQITLLNGLSEGDLVVYALMTQSGRTITGQPAGFTGVTWDGDEQTFGNNKVLSIRYGIATAPVDPDTVLTTTLSGGSIFGSLLMSVSGVDQSTPLDTQGAGASGTSTAPSFTDAGAHVIADNIGFSATFIVDGEASALTPDAAWSNQYQRITLGLGLLVMTTRIVSATTAITKTESFTGSALPWATNQYWFRDDGLALPVSTGGKLLKGVG